MSNFGAATLNFKCNSHIQFVRVLFSGLSVDRADGGKSQHMLTTMRTLMTMTVSMTMMMMMMMMMIIMMIVAVVVMMVVIPLRMVTISINSCRI